MKPNWRYTMLAAWAAAALSLSALASFAEPERGDKGPSAKVDVDRNSGSRKSYGDRGKEGAGKTHEDREGGDRVRSRRGSHNEVEARRDRGWKGPGDRDRIRRGRRYGWGPGISFYFSDGYYYGNCGWLKRRAIVTGSPIWWQRYHRCRDFD
jgi:hypothetical protein